MLPDKYYESEFHDCKDLGNGGFGIVRRARHAIFKDVALKVINTGITKHARDEIANMIKVRHPNIVEFYGILLSSKDIPIGYVMNFMADGSIHDVVHGEKCYQTKQAYTWIMNSAAGLAYLHMKKIVHRDVKPMNPIGTHRYMSPEAWNDPRGLSYSTDVWSLGVTVWEIHRRRLPPLPNLNGSFHLEWSPRSDIETGTMLKRMLTPIPKDRPSMEEIVEFALAKSETCGNGSIRSPIEKSLQNLSLGSSSSSASSSLEGRRKATIGSWLRTTASLSQKSANRPDVLKLTKQVEEVTGKMKNLNRLKKRSSIEKCLVAVQNMMSNWLEAVRKALLLYPELADCEQEGREVLDTFEKDAQMRLNIGAKESD